MEIWRALILGEANWQIRKKEKGREGKGREEDNV